MKTSSGQKEPRPVASISLNLAPS